MGNRDRAGNPRTAQHPIEDLLRQRHQFRRRAQHPGQPGRPRHARHPAGAQRGSRAHGMQVRPGDRCRDRAEERLRPQELLLPGPAQGLPDQPDGSPHRRQGFSRHHPGRRHGQAHRHHPRAPGGGRGQEPARRLPRHERHRPQPRRHAAAGDRLRAGHPQRQGGGGLRQGDPCPGALPGHLRRQHGRRLVALRLQRLGTAEGPGRVRHPRRDQERQLLPLHRKGDQPRGAAADRADRGRRQGGSGNPPVRPKQGRNALHAQQGGSQRLPLLPLPRPAAGGDRAELPRADPRRPAGTAGAEARALRTRVRPVGL